MHCLSISSVEIAVVNPFTLNEMIILDLRREIILKIAFIN